MDKLIENISNPLIGGIIIGIAASIMLVFTGKIAGISGILGASIGKIEKVRIWRYLFISGLIFGGFIMNFYFPRYFNYELNFSFMEIIIAGLFVGFGTQLGSGCTSGHGVCGLPRFSLRSLVATLVFMGTGILTVLIKGQL